MMRPSRSALLVVGLLAAAGATTATAEEGKILFVSNRDGNAQVYVMATDGTAQRALTRGPAENTEPAWSPDGKRIAFTSYRDGNAEIYVMDADGGNQRRLTDDKMADTAPTWTTDGRIVFRSSRSKWTNFYVMSADGSGLAQLTDSPMDKGVPLVSPDGRWIAFVVHTPSTKDVHVVSTAGGQARDLTGKLSKNEKIGPAWSPDSTRVLYVESAGGGLNIRSIGVDGSNPAKITDDANTNASPAWSPDGKRIAFVSGRDGASRMEQARGDIYVMNADGSGVKNLTHNPYEDNYPAWSADGRSIYFVSLRDGPAQIYAVDAQSGSEQRLTRNAGFDVMIRPMTTPATTPRSATVSAVSSRAEPLTH